MSTRSHRGVAITCGGTTTSVTRLTRFALLVAAIDPVAVIAADQGWHLAQAMSLAVDHLVGDLDSLDEATVAAARDDDVELHTASRTKDQTDLELAVQLAHSLGATTLVICDGGGDRADHALANIMVAAAAATTMTVTLATPTATITPVVDARTIVGDVGSVCSLLPVFGPATGVTTTGLLYPLGDERLEAGAARGVSNELVAPDARITVATGTVLVVQPT